MIKLVDGVEVSLTEEEIIEFRDRETAWKLAADVRSAEFIRSERDTRLATEVDVIAGNALRWASLTPEQQQAWADYRQALLDVPQQTGFPDNVVWPTKPE